LELISKACFGGTFADTVYGYLYRVKDNLYKFVTKDYPYHTLSYTKLLQYYDSNKKKWINAPQTYYNGEQVYIIPESVSKIRYGVRFSGLPEWRYVNITPSEVINMFSKPVKTYNLDKDEYGILIIKANNIPSETSAYNVNTKTYSQTIKEFGGGWMSCEYKLPLLPGTNKIYFNPKHNYWKGHDETTIRYEVFTLKNCEPHSVRELEIRKSTLFYIKYDKPAIGIFKLKRPLYQQNTSGCTSLAGGNIVTGWIAVKFPGSYCVVTGSGYRIFPYVHPFNIIDVSQSVLYVEKEEYATVTCQPSKHQNFIYATFKSDKPCNFTAVAYFNGKPVKYYQVTLTNSNKLTQTVVIPTSKEGNYCIAPKGENPNATEWKIRLI